MQPLGMCRRFISCCIAAMALAATASQSHAQNYPNRPIRIIVPFAAGGGSDIVTRIVANKLSERLGQAVIIDNRGGAGGNIGMEAGAHAAPDGYTLTVLTQNIAVNPHIYKELNFKPLTDFAPITQMNRFYQVVIVNPSLPVKNFKELLDYAKAKPGTLTAGNGGIGGTAQMDIDLLAAMAGVNIVQVPYRGEAPVITDVIGGQLNMSITSFIGIAEFVKAGKLRALAVTSPKPAPQFPDLPTIGDAVPGYEMDGWYGIAAPAGTPAAIVKKLETEIGAVIKDPAINKSLVDRGFDPAGTSAEEFAKIIKSDYEKYGKLVRERNIKIE
jgi:tripartite-type tricarboxylate transporter receptor subunit TctC